MIDPGMSEMIELQVDHSATNVIKFKNFPPSSVIAFSVSLLDNQNYSLESILKAIEQYDDHESEIMRTVSALDIIDLNYVLFRSNQEEMDETGKHGVYTLSSGPFTYCGLAGVMYYLAKIRTHNDLGMSYRTENGLYS